MKQLDLNLFQDFNDRQIARRILLDDPVRRMVLVSARAGQGLPEHGTPGPVSVYVISGRIVFFEGDDATELGAGALLCLAPGSTHKLEAKEDSRLLVSMIKPPDAAAWNSLAPAGSSLDLRGTPHDRRHGIVFWAFDTLGVGESFFLVNDHDPQPLRTQMEVLYPGAFSWEYVQRGPAEFRVRISRVAAARNAPTSTALASPLA